MYNMNTCHCSKPLCLRVFILIMLYKLFLVIKVFLNRFDAQLSRTVLLYSQRGIKVQEKLLGVHEQTGYFLHERILED